MEKQLLTIRVDNIIETDYCDDSSWVEFEIIVDDFKGVRRTYEIFYDERLETLSNEDLIKIEKTVLLDKYDLKKCTTQLQELIENARQAEDDMYYVSTGDISEKDIEILKEELSKFKGLENYIRFNEYGFAVTVFGGVITKFIF